jgi:alkanesulfonate monooxygenase SsuD/methylene tetrahydromethanopterin reductase-like flavin-dependent oxidoreductase (luciferase family)
MKFGIMLDAHVDKWALVKQAEELGYDKAWIPDSQMLWSDCYATLALAAVNTDRIHIGPGMTTPGTRLAPVTASAIGSINQLAPGRTFLGIATGDTAMRLIGQPPARPRDLAEYVRVVRALLDGEAVDYTYKSRTAEIQLMHQDRHYFNLDNRIPIYTAANGPKALRVAGELADGWVRSGGDHTVFAEAFAAVKQAAADANRDLPGDFLAGVNIGVCVLRPGEKLTDERVTNQTGAIVTANLHFAYEMWNSSGRHDAVIPPHFAEYWDDFRAKVDSYPEQGRFRYIHDGHATFMREDERKYVTPDAIRASLVVGEPDEIVERMRAFEAAGVTDVCLQAPADAGREVFEEFAESVMPHFG